MQREQFLVADVDNSLFGQQQSPVNVRSQAFLLATECFRV